MSVADQIRVEMRALRRNADLIERFAIGGNLYRNLREIADRLQCVAEALDKEL